MSLLNSLQTGMTGLKAAQQSISATSHNVTNALTPGYSRRDVDLSISSPLQRNGVWIGTGVNVDSVNRSADFLLATQQIAQSGIASSANTFGGDLQVVETWFDETSVSGGRLSLAAFFDALNKSTSNPADGGLRADVIQTGTALADSLNSTTEALGEAKDLFIGRLDANVLDVNDVLDDIATLNQQIVTGGGSLEAGDLADKRDLLLRQSAELIGSTTHFEADGSATVFVGGHAVVSGQEARKLYLEQPIGGAPKITVAVDNGRADVTGAVGGTIEGHLDARASVDGYVDDLNNFAMTFADAMNTQHNAGFARDGTVGQDLYSYTVGAEAASITFNAVVAADPELLAFSGDPTAFAGDATNLEALIAIEDVALFGSRTASDFLSSLTSRVGADLAGAQNTADRQNAVIADLDSLSKSLHGVDLDEEAANLISYQTAYQASAKVIATADQLLGTLMELI